MVLWIQELIVREKINNFRKRDKMKRLLLIFLTILLIISSYGFSKTNGLVTEAATMNYLDYAIDYESSLSNNNVFIGVGKILFSIVLLVEIILYLVNILFSKKRLYLFEILFYLVIGVFQEILLFLTKIDGCSVIKTLLYAKNLWLCFFIVILNIYIIMCIYYVNCQIRQKWIQSRDL